MTHSASVAGSMASILLPGVGAGAVPGHQASPPPAPSMEKELDGRNLEETWQERQPKGGFRRASCLSTFGATEGGKGEAREKHTTRAWPKPSPPKRNRARRRPARSSAPAGREPPSGAAARRNQVAWASNRRRQSGTQGPAGLAAGPTPEPEPGPGPTEQPPPGAPPPEAPRVKHALQNLLSTRCHAFRGAELCTC